MDSELAKRMAEQQEKANMDRANAFDVGSCADKATNVDPILARRLAEQKRKTQTGESSLGTVGSQADTTVKLDPILAKRISEQWTKAVTGESKLGEVGSQADKVVKLDPVLAKRFAEQQTKAATGESNLGEIGSLADKMVKLDPILAKRFAEQHVKVATGQSGLASSISSRAENWDTPEPALAARMAAQREKEKPLALVLGGIGILGRPLLSQLRRRGMRVCVMSSSTRDVLPETMEELLQANSCDYICLDIDAELKESGGLALHHFVNEKSVQVIVNLISNHSGVRYHSNDRQCLQPSLENDLHHCLESIADKYEARVINVSHGSSWSDDASIFCKCRDLATTSLLTQLHVPAVFGPMIHTGEDIMAVAALRNFLGANTWDYDAIQCCYPTRADDVAFVLAALAEKVVTVDARGQSYVYSSQQGLSAFDFMELFARATDLPLERLRKSRSTMTKSTSDVLHRTPLTESCLRVELGDEWKEPTALGEEDIRNIWAPIFVKEIEDVKQLQHMAVKVFGKPTLRNGVQYFVVDVTFPRKGLSYRVEQRYQAFRILRKELTALGVVPAANFPRKHLSTCSGARLAQRAAALEDWLRGALEMSTIDVSHSQNISPLESPLATFLEVSPKCPKAQKQASRLSFFLFCALGASAPPFGELRAHQKD